MKQIFEALIGLIPTHKIEQLKIVLHDTKGTGSKIVAIMVISDILKSLEDKDTRAMELLTTLCKIALNK